MTEEAIRILVVDDSASYRKIVTDVLTGVPDLAVVGSAANGRIALRKIEELRPDIITLDLHMPEMDGLDVLRQLKASGSRIRSIVLSSTSPEDAEVSLKALALGALDFVVKPTGDDFAASMAGLRRELVTRIQAFSRTRQVQNLLTRPPARPPPPAPPASRPALHDDTVRRLRTIAAQGEGRPAIVALGISTGGPQSLNVMMPRLPADLGVPIVLVQHMPPVFTRSLAESLDQKCSLTVSEGSDGEVLEANHVYVAPGGKQMKIVRESGVAIVRITDDPPENSCRPSVDYLFRSVAEVFGGNAVGVIMTGMGNDGAAACRQMKQRGATIIAQDESTCVVYGMPRQPIEEGVARIVAPLERIADEITRTVKEGVLACR